MEDINRMKDNIEDDWERLNDENIQLKHENFLREMNVHGIRPVQFITSKTEELFEDLTNTGFIDLYYFEFIEITEPLSEHTTPVRWYGNKASFKRLPELLANDKSKNAIVSHFFKLTDKVERKTGFATLRNEFEAREKEQPKTIDRKEFTRNIGKGGEISSIIDRFRIF